MTQFQSLSCKGSLVNYFQRQSTLSYILRILSISERNVMSCIKPADYLSNVNLFAFGLK